MFALNVCNCIMQDTKDLSLNQMTHIKSSRISSLSKPNTIFGKSGNEIYMTIFVDRKARYRSSKNLIRDSMYYITSLYQQIVSN